jgi:hypothetical protein
MIINKLQLITNYLDVGFIVRFQQIASCYIYNLILKLQKNDKKRHVSYIYNNNNNESRKKIKLT